MYPFWLILIQQSQPSKSIPFCRRHQTGKSDPWFLFAISYSLGDFCTQIQILLWIEKGLKTWIQWHHWCTRSNPCGLIGRLIPVVQPDVASGWSNDHNMLGVGVLGCFGENKGKMKSFANKGWTGFNMLMLPCFSVLGSCCSWRGCIKDDPQETRPGSLQLSVPQTQTG